MEIARRVRAGEKRSDVESKLESEDPTEVGDDASSFENMRGQEVMTLVVHHDPMAMSTGSGHEAERRGDVPMLCKCATSSDAVGEREVKRMRSPRSSEASPALSPPALGTIG